MQLTSNDKAKIDQWLAKMDGKLKCPICGATASTQGPPLGLTLWSGKQEPGKVRIATTKSQCSMVQYICGNCAYVMLFDATLILNL